MSFEEISTVWKVVFSKLKYWIWLFLVAILFYELNVMIAGWRSIASFFTNFGFFPTINFLFTLSLGFKETIKFHSFVSLIILSLMFGILVSLIIFKIDSKIVIKDKKAGFVGTLGIVLAALAPGCAACGLGLVSLLGIGAGFFALLPYEGLEFSILAILLLGFTIFKISKDLTTCEICKINLKNERRK